MAEHEPSIGMSDDWHTPASLLDPIGLTYDLDPCAPLNRTYYFVKAQGPTQRRTTDSRNPGSD